MFYLYFFRSGKDASAGAIATYNIDAKSSKDLRHFLSQIADQCDVSAADLPSVVILDNLHHVTSLSDVFNSFLRVKSQQRYF